MKAIWGKRKTVSSPTLTLTLIGKSCKIRIKETERGKKGKRVARLTSPSNTPTRGGGKGRGKERPAGGSARQDLANRAPSQGYSTAACSAMGEHARRRGTSRRRHLHLLHCCSFLGGAGTRRRGRREKEKERPGEQPRNSYGGRRPPRSPPPLPFSALREKASREMV